MRLILIGNYGVGNLGDEALREYFLREFPEVAWTVVPYDIPRLPFGIRSLFTPWWRTLHAYWNCDGVVFGGGSLFTDVESVKAPLMWGWHALVAKVFRKPLYLAFQGVGPFRTRLGEWCGRWVVRHASLVIVRDKNSYKRVRKWRGDVVLSFDPVFRTVRAVRERPVQNIFVLIPRPNSNQTFCNRAKELCEHGKFDSVKILSLQPSDPQEGAVCRNIQVQFPKSLVHSVHSLEELCAFISNSSFVLSQRYHGALSAFALGVPFETVLQKDGDKLSSLSYTDRDEALRLIEKGETALRHALYGNT